MDEKAIEDMRTAILVIRRRVDEINRILKDYYKRHGTTFHIDIQKNYLNIPEATVYLGCLPEFRVSGPERR